MTAQTGHSEGPRPQPREVKAVSHSEQSMMTRGTFRMDLTQPSKGIERKLLVKLVQLQVRILLDQDKRLRKQFQEEMKQGRLPGTAV